jgi:putative membrane protein
MAALAQVAALLGALGCLAAAPLEMFLFGRHSVHQALRVDTVNVGDVRTWAFVVGWRNLLAGAGTITGLVILHSGDEVVGRTVVLTDCAYMLVAGLAMGVADLIGIWEPRGDSVRGTIGSSVPPLVALVAVAVAA